ncbi:MAG: hypothetical protein NC400_14300 [Clostridium sp.]|nr:hypothetical protein [Clostridium sp.]
MGAVWESMKNVSLGKCENADLGKHVKFGLKAQKCGFGKACKIRVESAKM